MIEEVSNIFLASTPEYAEAQRQLAVLQSMQDFVGAHLHWLAPVAKAWQPSNYLPDLTAADWHEQLQSFRQAAAGISDEMLIILVGNMVTEEALPNYAVTLNLIAQEHVGDSPRPWSQWLRGWTAEENRHGDLLNAYLRLTGRVDMPAIELTIHHLIARGFNPKAFPAPYHGLIYTSFQERATRLSHRNCGTLVAAQGDDHLALICQRIAGDEARHEQFYTRMMGQVFELDPAGAMLAFREMLRTIIAMPGRLMFDGQDSHLFDHFATIAQRCGVYTVHDYAAIIDHLVQTWNVAGRRVIGPAAKAQDWLCRQSERYLRLADEVAAHVESQPTSAFRWIHDRIV
ncbi:MAG: acyl-ACP desaturase [Phycisphaerae bacterium]